MLPKIFTGRLVWYRRLAVAGLLISASFLSYQYIHNWIETQKYSSVEVQARPVRVIRLPPLETEVVRTIDCVPVQIILPKTSVEWNESPDNTTITANRSERIQIDRKVALDDLPLMPAYPLLLSRYVAKAPILSDLVLESYLLADGSNEIRLAQTQPDINLDLAELGRVSELGLWLGYEASQSHHPDLPSEYTQGNQFEVGWTVDLKYRKDLFRLFGNWTQLQGSVGFHEKQGVRASASVSPMAWRF
jgi:hypothetical protein